MKNPGVNNVRRGENLPPRPSTTNSNSSRNTNSVASSSMKRSKSARGGVKGGASSKNGSSVKSWRHDSSSTLDKGTRKSLNQQTQINENLRRKEILQRKEKMNKIPEACPALVLFAQRMPSVPLTMIKSRRQRYQKTMGRRILCWTIWKLNKNGKVDERSVHPVQVLLEEENES